jgi:hypothetical protein
MNALGANLGRSSGLLGFFFASTLAGAHRLAIEGHFDVETPVVGDAAFADDPIGWRGPPLGLDDLLEPRLVVVRVHVARADHFQVRIELLENEPAGGF